MKVIKVLVACEESQAVAMAFNTTANKLAESMNANVRFHAMSCDLQECSGGHPEYHHQGDAIEFAKRGWDLIIAHPPCTYLSNAGSNSLVRIINGQRFVNLDRYNKGLEARKFFMTFLEGIDCKYLAVENPTPGRIWNLPTATQAVQPYEYGHPYSKRTCLWLRGLPPLVPTEVVDDHVPYTMGGIYKTGKKDTGVRSAKLRSKTFKGIAEAMATQWGRYIIESEE